MFCLYLYSNFLNPFVKAICYHSKGSNNNWYHFHFSHKPCPCYFSLQVLVFLYFLSSLFCHSTTFGTAISMILHTISSFSTITMSGLLGLITWLHCMLKFHSILVLSISCTLLGSCSNHLSGLSNSYNLHSSQ